MDDDGLTARWERRAGTPLAVASVLYLASYAVRVLGHGLPEPVRNLCLALTCASWAMFVVDHAVRRRQSGQGLHFVHRHWLDSVVVLLPLLRPVRIVRVHDAVQRRHGHPPRMSLQGRVMLYAGMSAVLLGFTAALTVYDLERTAPHTTIHTFGDSLWWTVSTLSTVGYGDSVPVTPAGRLVATGLMGCGLGLLGAVAGSFSSWLMQAFSRRDDGGGPPGS
ncbi:MULTISPECIES: potassium channel family protein [unclassified Streptomyces]|uniref:potassium channel family protein n=1 Tax=unclassified Streptomyces TaxID=2593676 RepID=UPI003D8BF612